jgi:protoporphyrinogen/coproporphyrinogen III oxidase
MSTGTASPIDVAVVGGGITGLTAAYEARKRGLAAVVFEAAPRAGGLIDTDHIDGFTIEAGPDSLLTQKTAGLELCRELGLLDRMQGVKPPRSAYVLKGRTLHRLPSPSILGLPVGWRALLHYDLLSPAERVRLALERWIPPRPSGDDESVAAFFRRRFGRATVDVIAQPLLGGIHAGDVNQLSMRRLFPRLVEMEQTRGHVLEMRAPAESDRPRRPVFVAPAEGMSVIVRALADTLADVLMTSTAVERIQRAGSDGWHVWTGKDGIPLTARSVVLAVPAYGAATLLQAVDEDAARLCAEIPYASSAGVALAWPRTQVAHPLSGPGFVVARRYSNVRITACTWVSSKWNHRAPDEAVLIRAFLGGTADPGAIDLDDRSMIEIVRRDLENVLGITATPTLARVYRWRRASVQHNLGQHARVASIDARLAAHPGLFVAGSGFRAVGIPDCIADARAVVERIVTSRSNA